jgi:hypothetical protein
MRVTVRFCFELNLAMIFRIGEHYDSDSLLVLSYVWGS